MHTGTSSVKNCVALRGNINKKTDATKNVYIISGIVIHRKQVIEFSHIQYSIEYITSQRVLDIRVDRLIDSDSIRFRLVGIEKRFIRIVK